MLIFFSRNTIKNIFCYHQTAVLSLLSSCFLTPLTHITCVSCLYICLLWTLRKTPASILSAYCFEKQFAITNPWALKTSQDSFKSCWSHLLSVCAGFPRSWGICFLCQLRYFPLMVIGVDWSRSAFPWRNSSFLWLTFCCPSLFVDHRERWISFGCH